MGIKGLSAHQFFYRSYIFRIIEQSEKFYLVYSSKSNMHYSRRGQHVAMILSREDLARMLQNARYHLNVKFRAKMSKLEAKKAIKKAFVNPYHVGQVLYTSWGYDQTNIDFYQVTAVNKMSIKYREISSSCTEDSFMSGMSIPKPGSFVGEEHTAIIQIYSSGNHYVSDRSGHGMYPCEGKDIKEGVRCSWYA